jgi:hypothetical protein
MESELARLARAIKSPGNPAWLPRPTQSSYHLGQLVDTDGGNNVADFQFADPSGVVVPSVRVLQAYSANYQPQAGHYVWLHLNGTDPMIIGQHIPSTGFIIP